MYYQSSGFTASTSGILQMHNNWILFLHTMLFTINSLAVVPFSTSAMDQRWSQFPCSPPGLRSPSQLQSPTAFWPVANYTALCQRHNNSLYYCKHVGNENRWIKWRKVEIIVNKNIRYLQTFWCRWHAHKTKPSLDWLISTVTFNTHSGWWQCDDGLQQSSQACKH